MKDSLLQRTCQHCDTCTGRYLVTDRNQKALTTASPISGIPGGSLLPLGSSPLVPSRQVSPAKPKGKPKKGLRTKVPKGKEDSRIYKAVMVSVALRAQGVPYDEIAAGLGLTKNTIFSYMKIGRHKGWLRSGNFADPEDKLEIMLKSAAVRNIENVLDEKAEHVHVDKETGVRHVTTLDRPSDRAVNMTLEVAKGTGMLKQHQVTKSDGPTNLGVALKVVVEMPPSGATPAIRAGSIGGAPAFDAEIVEDK